MSYAFKHSRFVSQTTRQPLTTSGIVGSNIDTEEQHENCLEIQTIPKKQLANFLSANEKFIAGIVFYGEPISIRTQPNSNIPTSLIMMKQLQEISLVEVWTGNQPFTYVRNPDLDVAHNEHFLFGVIRAPLADNDSLESLTFFSYQAMLNQLNDMGYPHLLRIWNHFPNINQEQGTLDQYKRFCIGRHRAFFNLGEDFHTILPAATAVGTPNGPLKIHFLAGKLPGKHIENPRQLSAYHYPPIYGPKSPSFARATLAMMGNDRKLLIAGTASIVGHATQHQGNLEDQTKETLRNIGALLNHAESSFHNEKGSNNSEKRHLVKVYIRHQEHFPKIKEIITKSLGKSVSVLYLQGDICRSNLLVEIEGIFSFS